MIPMERQLRVSAIILFVNCISKICDAEILASGENGLEHRSKNNVTTLDAFYRSLPEISYEAVSQSCVANDAHKNVCALPSDCEDYFKSGFNKSGVYKIWPRNKIMHRKSIEVYCDMDTDGGGWTVLQRRGNYSRSPHYFYKNWVNYKNGFGNIEKDFWLGNDNIFALTNQKPYSVRFDLWDVNDRHGYALYDIFYIENEDDKYRITIEDYSGDAGDSMEVHNQMQFSTKDQDNDIDEGNCAEIYKGAWWYINCHYANLNGLYLGGKTETFADGIIWFTFAGHKESLAKTEIKIRPIDFKPC